MTKKPFLSIVFANHDIKFVKLDSKLTTVEKYASVPMPEGIVKNYFVVNQKALTDLIKKALVQLKITERTVGLVIPEFSTYIKTFTLPKLETSDFDEAVGWQVKDFIPDSGEEVAFDWKIVGENQNNVEILTVTVSKKLLSSYVDAVSAAGLFPVVVENPALSLSRIPDPQRAGRLIIYREQTEALLVVAQGEKILGSSVVGATDSNSLLATAQQIVGHYDNVKVEKVLVGGGPYDQQFLDGLANGLGLNVEWATLKIGGLAAADLQQYLLGILLQLKSTDEPKSDRTINLLPKDWVEKYQKQRSTFQVRSLAFVASLVIWVCFLTTLGSYFFMNREIKFLKEEVEFQQQAQAIQEDDPVAEAEKINGLSRQTQEVLAATISPEKIVNSINEKKPAGVDILGYQLELEAGTVSVLGRAATRADVVNFKTSLEEVEEFVSVRLPITSLQQETDLDFQVSITIEGLVNKSAQPIKLKL